MWRRRFEAERLAGLEDRPRAGRPRVYGDDERLRIVETVTAKKPEVDSQWSHRLIESGQYTSWVFGQRLRHAGLLGSMRTVGDALDNAVAESFFASLQCELLDRHAWPTRAALARAMFAYIETFYNPVRRHSTLGYLSPHDYENTAVPAA